MKTPDPVTVWHSIRGGLGSYSAILDSENSLNKNLKDRKKQTMGGVKREVQGGSYQPSEITPDRREKKALEKKREGRVVTFLGALREM